MHTELAILGGGPGGYAAAFLAADLGVEATIVESRPSLGGVCLMEGCIPSKALLHVAVGISDARELEDWGVRFGEPEIDLDAMRERKNEGISKLTGGLGGLAKKRKVRVIRAEGRLTGPNSLSLAQVGDTAPPNSALDFERCILATGSSRVIPKPMRIDSKRMMTSREALELPDVPETLLVIGGGYIGLELGIVYARLGSRVTLVEMLPGILGDVDRDLVKPLTDKLDGLFADLRVNTKVAAMKDTGRAVEVTLESDEGSDTRQFDRVLLAVGRKPNTADIGLDSADVELDDDGFVRVDEQMRTTRDNIFAVGDLAGQPMLAHKAFHEGYAAAEAAAGQTGAAFDKRAIPAVVFSDPEIAYAGLSEADAQRQGIGVEVARFPWAANGRAQSLGRAEGLTKMIFQPGTNRLLGAGIVGPDAGDLITEAVLAIEMGCSARDVAGSIHPHPTFSETLAGAAEVQLGVATELYRPLRD